MKISEIIVYPSSTGHIEKYQQYVKDCQLHDTVFPDLYFAELFLPDDQHLLFLVNEESLIKAILHLEIRETNWQISRTETAPEYQNQGCMRYLLIRAVNRHQLILSDETQTPEAIQMWKALIANSGGQFDVKVHDSGEFRSVDEYDDGQIWNQSVNPVLAMTNRLTEDRVIVDESRELRFMKNPLVKDRSETAIWFTKKAYINP